MDDRPAGRACLPERASSGTDASVINTVTVGGVSRRTKLIALVAVVILGVVAGLVVVARDREVAGTATAGATFWERLESTPSEPDGPLGLELSLQAFAYTFGGLPGVTLPDTPPEPKGFGVSGSGPIRWVLRHWDKLTAEQQAAVATVLAPVDTPRLRMNGQDDKTKAEAVLRPVVDQMVTDIGAKLGRAMPKPTVKLVDIENTFEDGSPSFGWSMVFANGDVLLPSGTRSVIQFDQPAVGCNIYLPPSLWRTTTTAIPPDARATIAHEIGHCYQGFGYPTLGAYRAAPRWVIEGGAEFIGTDYTKHAVRGGINWRNYLKIPTPLIKRTYSAVGWWFHLQHVGHDPWRTMPGIWAASTTADSTSYVLANGDLDDVYDTWASSFLRAPGFGDAWEVHGADVPADVPPFERIRASGGTLAVPAYDARVARVSPVTEPINGVDTILLVTANQPIRAHDQGTVEDVHIAAADYCLGGRCVCPSDTERAGEQIKRIQQPLWLAVPGGETGTAVTTDTMTMKDYCRKKPDRRDPPKPGGPPPGTRPHAPPGSPSPAGAEGPAPVPGSTGDPHLTTFDGHGFEFQEGGEFTLVRADAGDMEVQTRQEPPPGLDGKPNLSVSANTAAAANVNGDRLSITAAPDRPVLLINGTPATPRTEQALPKGGTVAPDRGGYLARWPDGSTMAVFPVNNTALNVLVQPAPSRKNTVRGMLGTFEGVPGGRAMTDRAGRRYPTVTTRELYDVIGESWRVPADGSLFDYAPGQSTATFTRDDMPGQPFVPSADAQANAEAACAGLADERLRAHCVYDTAVTGDPSFAPAYQAVHEYTTAGGGSVRLGTPVGPEDIEQGQLKSFTLTTDETDLYFAADTECDANKPLYWRVTGPDGQESLSTPMCEDVGRRHTDTPGTWTITVNADAAGTFTFRVIEAGATRTFPVSVPATVRQGTPAGAGTLSGAGAEHRFTFAGLAGDTVTAKSTMDCTDDGPLYWGLESPDGYVISLRTQACEDLDEQTLTADGDWSVVVFNHTDDQGSHDYAFTLK